MKNTAKLILIMIFLAVNIICIYTIIDQERQIEQLEQQLQEVQMKYEIIKNDPLAKDAMEAGG
jgi:regulatory protein YycI of two-component signal transduction system YycFG